MSRENMRVMPPGNHNDIYPCKIMILVRWSRSEYNVKEWHLQQLQNKHCQMYFIWLQKSFYFYPTAHIYVWFGNIVVHVLSQYDNIFWSVKYIMSFRLQLLYEQLYFASNRRQLQILIKTFYYFPQGGINVSDYCYLWLLGRILH